MKKQLLISSVITLSVVSVVGALVTIANGAKPSDSLYSVDRFAEKIQLSVLSSTNKVSYAKFNLTLASERLQEIKDLQTIQKVALLPKVYAQSTTDETQKLIDELLVEISKNIAEANKILLELPDAKKEELSLEISDKTTEFGDDLQEIVKKEKSGSDDKINDVVAEIEKVDSSAIGFLVNAKETESESESETEHSKDLVSTIEQKFERKLLKLREELRIYIARLEVNKSKLPDVNVTLATKSIADLGTALDLAETKLTTQEYKTISDLLDRTDDGLDKLKDLVKVEGQDDSKPAEGSTESGDDNSSENEAEKPEDTKSPSQTPKPTGTKKVEQSEKPEDTEKPEQTEKPETTKSSGSGKQTSGKNDDGKDDEAEVHGIQIQPSTDADLLLNRLRF